MRLTSFEGINSLTKRAQSKIQWIAIQLHAKHPIGREVRSKVIESWKKLSGAEVRSIISCLRNNNFPIGSNSKGYFWAFNDKELTDTWKHLSERANSLIETARQVSYTMQNMRTGKHVSPLDSGKLEL